MFNPNKKRKLTIEIRQEKEKFYAIIWQEEAAIRKSDHFNTAAGASVAGYLLLSEEQEFKKTPHSFEARSSAAI